MVIDSLLAIVCGVFSAILDLVPSFGGTDITSNTNLVNLGATIGTYAGKLNGYFPVTVLAVCVGFWLAVRVVTTVWLLIVWVYDRFPLKFT